MEQKSLDDLDNKKSKEIRMIENNLNIDFNIEKQAYKDSSIKLGNVEDEKFFELKLEVARAKKTREDTDEKILNEFAQSVLKINSSVELESKLREEGYNKLLNTIREEISKYYKTLETQTKHREESHHSFNEKVDEFQTLVKDELNKERFERETTENYLLKLLEDTCNRVEGVFSS